MLIMFIVSVCCVCHIYLVSALPATKISEVIDKEGKFINFQWSESPRTGHRNDPIRPLSSSSQSSFNKPSKYSPGIGTYVVEIQRPEILSELDLIRSNGLKSINNGLRDITRYVGGKIGYLVGAPVGFDVGMVFGALKGTTTGANQGAAIGVQAAENHLNFLTNLRNLRNRLTDSSEQFGR